jgi:hypothetical protein
MPSAFSTDRPSGHNNEPCSFCYFYLFYLDRLYYKVDGVAVNAVCAPFYYRAIILLQQLGFTVAHNPSWYNDRMIRSFVYMDDFTGEATKMVGSLPMPGAEVHNPIWSIGSFSPSKSCKHQWNPLMLSPYACGVESPQSKGVYFSTYAVTLPIGLRYHEVPRIWLHRLPCHTGMHDPHCVMSTIAIETVFKNGGLAHCTTFS